MGSEEMFYQLQKLVFNDQVYENSIDYSTLYEKVLSLQTNIRKECSPKLRTVIRGSFVDSIIDEGSELNCICSSVAARCGLRYEPIKIKAMAAGSNTMKLLGVIPNDVVLNVCDAKDPAEIPLKNDVVVKNLGPNVLIGEPGKMDNNIVTFPKQKLIQLTSKEGRSIRLPYHSHCGTPLKDYQAYSVKEDVKLYPLKTFNIQIPAAMQCDAVVMSL